jgi:group I intron endonuclease
MHYIVYQTTNLINNMTYIGSHQTEDLNDGYLGSGKHLKRAIKKYGKENFKFEILHSFSIKEEMFSKERELVDESFVNDPLTYNLKIGGSGGNPGIVGAFKGRKHTEETKDKIRKSALTQTVTEEKRKKLSENNWARKDPDAHKEHMRKIAKMPRSADHNKKVAEANLGKILVNSGNIAKRISATELEFYKNMGWSKGGLPRKYKSNRKTRDQIEFEIITCPFCNKLGKKNAMMRWHFDNCKLKG